MPSSHDAAFSLEAHPILWLPVSLPHYRLETLVLTQRLSLNLTIVIIRTDRTGPGTLPTAPDLGSPSAFPAGPGPLSTGGAGHAAVQMAATTGSQHRCCAGAPGPLTFLLLTLGQLCLLFSPVTGPQFPPPPHLYCYLGENRVTPRVEFPSASALCAMKTLSSSVPPPPFMF